MPLAHPFNCGRNMCLQNTRSQGGSSTVPSSRSDGIGEKMKIYLTTKQGQNGHETFRQARIYNFRDKCVVFAHNIKFSNLTQ